jgi:hypothetical protein
MDKVNQYAFYEFGDVLGQVRVMQEGADIADLVWYAMQAETAIEKFLKESAHVPLRLSKLSAQKLLEKFRKLSDMTVEKIDWNRKVHKDELSDIHRMLDEFEAVFSNEAQGLDVFSIRQKQAYSMTTLIEHGEEVLPKPIRDLVSDFAKNEIREATKCIAFDLPTAAGFHMLRGLESALRDYYDILSNGAPRPTTKHGKDVPMGNYVNEVERLGAHEKVVSVLRQIKTLHRDPHMHPESVFEMDGAVMLLGIVTSAIWAMFKEFSADDSDLSAVDIEDADDTSVASAATT